MRIPFKLLTLLGSILPILFTLSSCSEIFEGDLKDDKLVVTFPTQDLVTVNTQIQFLWDELEEATSYHLQIATPSFSELQSIELDSSIVGKTFQTTLNPGKYEWRIYAQNAITQTKTVSGHIHIDSTADLSLSTVNLLSPSNHIYSNQLTQLFTWENMYNADTYQFSMQHSNSDTSVNESNLTSESISINFAYDGGYTWEVIGKNNISQTQSQPSSRQFVIDTYNPELPSSLEPVDNSIIDLTQGGDSLVSLTWFGEVTGANVAPVSDYIQVATSNSFQNQSLIYNEELSELTNAERQFQVKILQSGTYYWRVKSVDQAQNTEGYTSANMFTVNFIL